jgi:hypothetical protein
MDTFQLLMSTINTLDAQTSLEQAARGSRLTWLAFIYAPLSFVTGMYGMNVKEINGSPVSAWVTRNIGGRGHGDGSDVYVVCGILEMENPDNLSLARFIKLAKAIH